MMGRQTVDQSQLFYLFNLEERIPARHLLRGPGHLLRSRNQWLFSACNFFANVGWVFGLHDRPWPERPVFGSVRYMNAAGLERKTDIHAYVGRVGKLDAAGR